MSSFTTALLLLPFLFLGNLAGFEVVRSMAIIIVGGLAISTLLNLFALPALYLRYGASREVDLGLQPVSGAGLPALATDWLILDNKLRRREKNDFQSIFQGTEPSARSIGG